jgi:hypothetical protein
LISKTRGGVNARFVVTQGNQARDEALNGDGLTAKTVHDAPSILVSALYVKGAPRDSVMVEDELVTADGTLRVLVVPGENEVTAVAIWPRGSRQPGRVEHSAKVEWQDWRFNSRRPWVLCSWCGRRCARIFLSRTALAGSLVCRRCAGVRYKSQDYNQRERLLARRDELLKQLGAGPAELGLMRVPVPRRPSGMHYRRYDALVSELEEIQQVLHALLGEVLRQSREEAHMLMLLTERLAAAQKGRPPAS